MTNRRSDDERSQDRFTEMTAIALRSQRFGARLFLATAVFVALASSAISAWNTISLRQLSEDTHQLLRNDLADNLAREIDLALEKREREFGTPSLRCLLEQLSEHRHLNALAHRSEAAHEGFSYPIPPDEEPPPVSDAETVCAQFFGDQPPATKEGGR